MGQQIGMSHSIYYDVNACSAAVLTLNFDLDLSTVNSVLSFVMLKTSLPKIGRLLNGKSQLAQRTNQPTNQRA